MDFSKFRETGDLSDITVSLDNKEFKLHKFPLFAKSDYFCELARAHPGNESESIKVNLKDFPGGKEMFGIVADYCYNMPIQLTENNVVAGRCAAGYLKMSGPGNLVEMTDTFLADTLSAAKLSGATAVIVTILMNCKFIDKPAETGDVVSLCIDALVECLLKSSIKSNALRPGSVFGKSEAPASASAFTRIQYFPPDQCIDQLNETSFEHLISLPPDWFAKILVKARDRGVNCYELGNLGVKYVSSLLEHDSNKEHTTSLSERTYAVEETNCEKDTDTAMSSNALTSSARASFQADGAFNTEGPGVDVGPALDAVLMALPDQAFNIPAVTMEWLTKVLRVASAHDCKCKVQLVRVTSEMLTRLSPEDLCIISPSILHDIVENADGENGGEGTELNGEGVGSNDAGKLTDISKLRHSERACRLVDTYMSQMSSKKVLTSDIFHLLVSATKNFPRPSHDSLYDVLEFILKSEAGKLTQEKRTDLADLVNYGLVNETNLQRALDADVISPARIAACAIHLCSKLRSELTSVKYIAELQEEDIQKFQIAPSSSSLGAATPAKQMHPSPRPLAALKQPAYYSAGEMILDSGLRDTPEWHSNSRSPQSSFSVEDLDRVEHHVEQYDKTDPLRAAQDVLAAARHKLALPIYTGYRPSYTSQLGSPSGIASAYAYTSPRNHHHNYRHHLTAAHREHDISLQDELEFKVDRPFRSLDPRVRHHTRLVSHLHCAYDRTGQRQYFPYNSSSSYTNKY